MRKLDEQDCLTPEERKEKKKVINELLGSRLQEVRTSERNNYNQYAMAKYLGTSYSHISRIENGTGNTNFADVKLLADFLGVSLDMLCGNTPLYEFEKMQNSYVYAFLVVLEQLKAQVHVVDNNITLSISADNDCPNYSSREILKFFEEYEIIQNFAKTIAKEDMVKTLVENLEIKYQHLPGFPAYAKIIKEG